jgi:hypothetical protein
MAKVSSRSFGYCVLSAVAALLVGGLAPRPAQAQLGFSQHNFSGTLTPSGPCGACHRAHGGLDTTMWVRPLGDERTYFDQVSNPDYLPDPTVQCYDCHDEYGASGSGEVDSDPDHGNWDISDTGNNYINDPQAPQDIAFTDGPGGDVGYYELIDGTVPGTTPPDGDPTGGHYWRTNSDIASAGDKVACTICHNPHASDPDMPGNTTDGNEAMIWEDIPRNTSGGTITTSGTLDASRHSRHGDGDGRDICKACHGLQDEGSPESNFYGVSLPRPPDTVGAHYKDSGTPCANCHQHNRIYVQCDDCHGFPPLNDTAFDKDSNPNGQSYSGGAGAHQRHLDFLGIALFRCEICHGPHAGANVPYLVPPEEWHDQGGGTVSRGNVDIMGESAYWDPGGTRGPGAAGYTGTTSGAVSPVPTGYEFTAKGATDGTDGGRCYGFACHGDPPNSAGALNWTDDMIAGDFPDLGGSDEPAVCWWCHDSSQAFIGLGGTPAPNVLGTRSYGDSPPYEGGSDGTDYGANKTGHGRSASAHYKTGNPAADKFCTKCHDATYTVAGPVRTHFDDVYPSPVTLDGKRILATINGKGVTGVNDTLCQACHRPSDAGTQGDEVTVTGEEGNIVSTHSNVGYAEAKETPFTQACRDCHEPHGMTFNGSAPNIAMVRGTVAGNTVVFVDNTAGSDYASTDGSAPYDGICEVCHTSTGWYESDGNPGGPNNGTSDHATTKCTDCHLHNYDDLYATLDGFMPKGGWDIEQFFDAASTAENYNAVSSHPLNTGSLDFGGGAEDCIGCHQTANGTGVSNECLKCHVDNSPDQGTITGGGSHTDKIVQLATPSANNNLPTAVSLSVGLPDSGSGDQRVSTDYQAFCLGCHGGSTTLTLDGNAPPDVSTSYESSGHGANASLSSDRAPSDAGPANLDCRDCHFSTVHVGSGEKYTDVWPGFHASINDHLVANVTASYQNAEYDSSPDPGDKNDWCLTTCHTSDTIVDHTWAPENSETADQAQCPLGTLDPLTNSCETHPSFAILDIARALYQDPTGLPPMEDTDKFICIHCHDPHGTSESDGQMIRLDFSGSTLCDECHL